MSSLLISHVAALLTLLTLASAAAAAASAGGGACDSAFNCSLNGACNAGACACSPPWSGATCATLTYATTTPASGQNLFTANATANSWNGPIIQGADGTFHLFDPIYEHGSLWSVMYYAHGTASSIAGPYDWSSQPTIASTAINPAALVYPDAATGALVYTLWIGDDILVSNDAAGPYAKAYANPAPSNTAPAFYKGSFYVTDQDTSSLLTATSLKGPWTKFSSIPHPPGMGYVVEDPFLYVDPSGNFHIINHAYNTGQRTNCTSSWVSSHFFSADGVTWGHSDQPYGHTVAFDDGTSHSYCTLERPNLFFDAAGQPSAIHFAADLVTEDAGCPNRGKGCVDCKYADPAGTLLVLLATGA
jgi:hypothetical protein